MNAIIETVKFTGKCVSRFANGVVAGLSVSTPVSCLALGLLYGGTLALYKPEKDSDKTDKTE